MLITINGKCGIKATILADSISMAGVRMLSFEIEYPRLILAELNTHRDKSRNSFSSRAVPFDKMLKQLGGRPVRFGANQAGMQDKGKDYDYPVWLTEYDEFTTPDHAWNIAKESAIIHAKDFKDAGYHKQVYNRLLEPFQMMKTVISGTEWENFWWLRDHDAADPTFHELVRCMREAASESVPTLLRDGEWHLPYVDTQWATDGEMLYVIDFPADAGDPVCVTIEEAIKVSCARCAAVSYRNEGYDLAKSLEVYDKLVGADRKHASAFEHQATPMKEHGYYKGKYSNSVQYNHAFIPFTWEEGISHVDRKGKLWSGNLKNWIQYRKLIPEENHVE